MIRLLFLIIIATVVLVLAYIGFKTIPLARKMTVAGGALAAAAVALLMQSSFAWYMPVLALVAISLVSSLVYMKLLEKEEKEKEQEAEERKARRQELISAAPSTSSIIEAKKAVKEPETIKERETIKVPEKVIMPETVKMPELKKEPEPEREPELVGAKPFGMQSIKPVGKEDQREQ
ncbi:hypothetical protein QWY16_07810 [Planococcus shenhongbingii]|uniref:hypothetical protein n=1 Tax=Planococcus shenhongbingii TaxID=3058398 RepID=UPI00260267FE|nr:hypothetical protein [Planococcus sp. N016]WKA60002.1 hypothetical protein QWY16_07810 [Planococcus sp. N016]